MEFCRAFYISESRIDPCGPEPQRILDVGTSRNAALGVTGALCLSGPHFAQVLEGTAATLEELMRSIRADVRHRMLVEWPLECAHTPRWFPGWTLGYAFDERLEQALDRLAAGRPEQRGSLVAPRIFDGLALHRAAAAGPWS